MRDHKTKNVYRVTDRIVADIDWDIVPGQAFNAEQAAGGTRPLQHCQFLLYDAGINSVNNIQVWTFKGRECLQLII